MASTSNNYDYLRRKNSTFKSSSRDNSLRISHSGRTNAERVSNGTVHSDTSTSSGHDTIHTALTEPPSYSKKLVVVGDGGCGKTCLLISYAEGHFPEKYVPTVFENYITITPHPKSGKPVELALWDTAGQEEYDRLRPLSYPETDLLFVCFAIDCPNSLENVVDKWYPEVLHFCPTTPIILCGLKSDLRGNSTCINLLKAQGLAPITPQQGQAVATKMGAIYMECSAKERVGVEDIFDAAIILATGEEDDDDANHSLTDNSPFGQAIKGMAGRKKKKKSRMCKIL